LWQVTKDGFAAAGRGGQRLYVVPRRDLVIVHLADTSGGKRIRNSDVKRLYRMILDAQGSKGSADSTNRNEQDESDEEPD
jgi:CubicO group peptidase (beta-lactamase class C family)